MVDELRKKVFNLLSSVITTYYMKAPTGQQIPYCVFTFYLIPHSFDTGSSFESVQMQVSVFDNQLTRMFATDDSIVAVLDNAESSLNLTAYNCSAIKRKFIKYEQSDNIYASHIEYEITFNN